MQGFVQIPKGLFLLVITALLVAYLALRWRRLRGRVARRRRQMEGWARRNGLVFDDAPDFHVFYQFPQFQCLQPGLHRHADNIVRGEWRGRNIMTFDYHFVADNNVRCEFSAVIAESHVPLKPLLIRPEKFRDKMAHSLGLRDIEFESAEFNRMFWVGSPDGRWAHDVLHPRAMEVLISKPDFIIKLEARHAIAYRPMLMPVFQFRSAVEVVCGLLDLLPAYLAGKENAQG